MLDELKYKLLTSIQEGEGTIGIGHSELLTHLYTKGYTIDLANAYVNTLNDEGLIRQSKNQRYSLTSLAIVWLKEYEDYLSLEESRQHLYQPQEVNAAHAPTIKTTEPERLAVKSKWMGISKRLVEGIIIAVVAGIILWWIIPMIEKYRNVKEDSKTITKDSLMVKDKLRK